MPVPGHTKCSQVDAAQAASRNSAVSLGDRMILKSRYWSRGFTLSLFVAITLACGIRQDEFDCENAYAHLQQCCTGVALPPITCRYVAGGCDEGPTYPDLSIAESDCIRSQSCDVVRATGMCEGVSQFLEQPVAASGGLFACPNGLPVGEPDGGSSWAIDAPGDDGATTPGDAAGTEPLDAEDADAEDAEGTDAAGDAENADAADLVDAARDAESDGEALDATPDRAAP